MVKVATRISLDDEQVGPYLPDIGIFDDTRCRAFVEIELTHANTAEKISYCETNDIRIVNVDIRQVVDPVAFVKRETLSVASNVCPYVEGTTCHCGNKKLAKTFECIECTRLNKGIDIYIAGNYRPIQPKMGTWAAIVIDADGDEFEYSGRDVGNQGSMATMLRAALWETVRRWQGTYPVRIHSKEHFLNDLERKKYFKGRATPIRYWHSLKDNGGTGEIQPERQGRLVSDSPILIRAARATRELFDQSTALSA